MGLRPGSRTGDTVAKGDIIGTVREFHFEHRILVPHKISGKVTDIRAGTFTVEEIVCTLDNTTRLSMMQLAVRIPRPHQKSLTRSSR